MAEKAQNPKENKIGVGTRVGKLTVVSPTRERRAGYMVWKCRCDCGGEVFLDTRCLQRGTVTDCGCGGKVKAGQKDLTGRRFGKLLCLEPTEERGANGGVVWRCRCDCGNECLAVGTRLTQGYKKSCGRCGIPPPKRFLGKRFGALTVTGYDGKRNGTHYWRCLCDCGNETVVSQTNLRSGHTQSCGCLQAQMFKKNLRLVDGTSVTMIENRMRTTIKSNTSGYNGVYLNRKNGTWAAQITFKGKTYYLGSYRDIQDAVRARRRGEEMYDNFLDWYYSEYQNTRG